MSQLNQFLDGFAPPPVPGGLAARSAQAAARLPQERRSLMPWRRGGVRGGWRRGIGALNLYIDFINMFLFLLRFMGDRR